MPSSTSRVAGGPPARLEVRLLGAVEVVLDGRRLRAFGSPRLHRLLALLAVRDDLQHRARLAFALWPDSEERQARTNLRKLLHELRQALPDADEFVAIDNETVVLGREGATDVDVWRFRDAVASADPERAARLYGGDLAPALYDDWVLAERAALRAEARAALVRSAGEAAERGDHDAAIAHAQRLIDLEPTDEVAAGVQMHAHLALGDRSAALRAYHRCAEALERELGVPPGEGIAAVYRRLREGAGEAGRPRPAGPGPLGESPFTGRERESHRLDEAWSAAREGGAHLVLVSGEPGTGKSRLAGELGRRARAQGHAVAAARAYEAAGALPWGPVVDLLRSPALRRRIDTLDPFWRTELARLLPELLDRPGPPPRPGAAGDLARRHRLFDAVARAVVGDRPLLVIIDDLQWCDAETVEVIGYVVRSARPAPVLVVGTLRPGEVPDAHPLAGLIDALEREGAVTTVALEPLDEAATAALAARLGGHESIDPQLAERLWSETEGNPLFIVETLRAGIPPEGSRPVLTPTMRAVLRGRLGRLPDGARRVAEVAAVVGRPFSIELMSAATGIGDAELIDHLDELWHRRILRDEGATYDFSHDTLRAVALEMVSPARRRRLHRAVAEAIAAAHRDDAAAAAPLLAAHYDGAGLVEPAIEAYRAAGARAVAVSAFADAVTMFGRALGLLVDLPASPGRDALELDIRIALGSPLVAIDGYGSARAHRLYARALALCRRLGRPVEPAILRGLGLARLQGCRFGESAELGQALLDAEARDPVAGTEGRYLLGVSAFWRGDLAGARAHLEGALAAYDVSRRDEHLASYAQDPAAVCLVRLALVELWAGDPARADRSARAALRAAVDLDHLMTLWYVTTYAAVLAAESEDLDRLAELLVDAEALWARLPMRYLGIVGDALRGWRDVCAGAWEGVAAIEAAVARSRAEGETLHLTYCLLLLARARALAGELGEGRAVAREGLSWSHRHDQRYLEAELWRIDGELAYRGGEREVAAASIERAADVAASQGAGWLELRALCSLAARFDGHGVRRRLGDLLGTMPSGHDLPPLRTARDLMGRRSEGERSGNARGRTLRAIDRRSPR